MNRKNVIKIAFSITWHYVLSFFITSNHNDVIDRQIVRLRKIFVKEYSATLAETMDYETLMMEPVAEVDEYMLSSAPSDVPSDAPSNRPSEISSDVPSESTMTEYENGNTYSIKVDSIGRYDAKIRDKSGIHVNLKNKTIDVSDGANVVRLPLQQNQIVVL